ncbi:MAG: hypothetical protein H6R19_1346 [Proteobacteria bacterium]|nr:hypothetical protein [Pseudomonadota bacterium]
MGQGGLHDYEAWLDTLDKKLYLAGSVVQVEFDNPLTIRLSNCTDAAGLKLCALSLREALRKNHSHLPVKYLLERFLRIVIKANKIPFSRDQVMNELREEWDIKNDYTDF